MGSVNVNRSVADAFYRYKMPRICAKVEGKGNGIKTVIVNMVDVAKALGRPPTYPTKYFGCELGAQTQFDFKNERYIVNGSHDSAKLQDLLDGFIRKFVLCPECDNPETELLVSTKKNTISQGCKACGYHGQLEFNHKLNTFILKNPPGAEPGTQGASLTEGGRKRSKRSNPSANTSAHNANGHDQEGEGGKEKAAGGGEDGERSEKRSEERSGKRDRDRERRAAEDDDDEWTVDVSEEAVRARMHDLTDSAKCMTLSDDTEKNEKQRMDLFYSYLRQRADAGQIFTQKANTEILHEAERVEVKSRAPLVLVEVLVREGSVSADVRRARSLLVRFTHDDARAQRHLLYGIERLCQDHPAMLPKVPAILHLLYELDVVEEKGAAEWAARPSRKYVAGDVAAEVRRRAQPFLDWLRTADTDDEDDSDGGAGAGAGGGGGNDIEIEYSDRAAVGGVKQASAPEPRARGDDEGDDLDIDAI